MTSSSQDSVAIAWQLGFPPSAREERNASQALYISALSTEDQCCRGRDRGKDANNQQMEKQLQPATFTEKGDKSLPHSEI